MKPLGSYRPEPPPPPPTAQWWTAIAASVALILGIGAALYCARDAGVVGRDAALAIMVFVAAAVAGILIAVYTERRAHRDAAARFQEVPPPFDVYLIWPPDCGWTANPPPAKRDAPRIKPPRGKDRT